MNWQTLTKENYKRTSNNRIRHSDKQGPKLVEHTQWDHENCWHHHYISAANLFIDVKQDFDEVHIYTQHKRNTPHILALLGIDLLSSALKINFRDLFASIILANKQPAFHLFLWCHKSKKPQKGKTIPKMRAFFFSPIHFCAHVVKISNYSLQLVPASKTLYGKYYKKAQHYLSQMI